MEKECLACQKKFKVCPYEFETRKYCSKQCFQPKIEKVCVTCKKIVRISPHRFNSFKHCSKQCQKLATPTKKCLKCGIEFRVKQSEYERKKYCSKNCQNAAQIGKFKGENNPNYKVRISKKCLCCQKIFEVTPCGKNRKFCSKSCADSAPRPKRTKIITKSCLSCHNVFEVTPCYKNKKFCTKKCLTEFKKNNRKRFEKPCKMCGKLFEVVFCRKDLAVFCSRKCLRVFEESKRIIKTCPNCQNEFSVRKSQNLFVYCSPKCRKEFTKKRIVVKNCPTCEKDFTPRESQQFCSLECYYSNEETTSKLSKLRKGKPLPQFTEWREFNKTPEGRRQNSERAKKYYAKNPEKHINNLIAQKGFESSLEKKMRIALEKAKIKFKRQYNIGKFWADFALLKYRLVIECDGEYWHNTESDAKRDAFMISKGWRVLRFPEKQINTDIESCLAEIKKAIRLIIE